jgi:membrane associated rhomboid family serine protease
MAYNSTGNSFGRTTPIVLNLIIINVLVWVAQLVFDRNNFFLTNIIALEPFNSGEFKPYQLLTSMFAHASYDMAKNIQFSHILFNMFALWTFGSWLEKVWGAKRFLIFYLACGLAGGVAHLVLENVPALGASGAIMGLFAAFAYLFPNTQLFMFLIPIPIKAKYAVAIMVCFDLFGGIVPNYGGGIAHFAHLGGLVMGFILVLIWNKTNKKTFY